MIESPLYQEIVEEAQREGATEARREDVLRILANRFGGAAKDLEVELKALDYERLEGLLDRAMSCRSLASFRKHLWS